MMTSNRITLGSLLGAAGLLAIALVGGASDPATADSPLVAQGQKAFAACAACHGTAKGERKLGPTLFGVVGRKAGSIKAPAPSPALANSGKTWTTAELDAFLASPRKAIPGNRMPYGGMPDPKQRKAVIQYLATLK